MRYFRPTPCLYSYLLALLVITIAVTLLLVAEIIFLLDRIKHFLPPCGTLLFILVVHHGLVYLHFIIQFSVSINNTIVILKF